MSFIDDALANLRNPALWAGEGETPGLLSQLLGTVGTTAVGAAGMDALDAVTGPAKDELEKVRLARVHNRESYKAQAELAALQLNEEQRSDAIAAFQQQSAGEAALGGSGLEGGTPFWALKMQAGEATRQIQSAFVQGENQVGQMGETARYNDASLKLDAKAAQRELLWAPINAVVKGVSLAFGMEGIIDKIGDLFGGGGKATGGYSDTGGTGKINLSERTQSLLSPETVDPYSSLGGGRGYGTISLGIESAPGGYGSINPGSILAPPGSFSTSLKVQSPLSWLKFGKGSGR
jgi:hypothetical protein